MKLEKIPIPIGQLIIDSGLGEMTQDGLYLHYTDVITMMRKYAESEKQNMISSIKKAIELLPCDGVLENLYPDSEENKALIEAIRELKELT